MFEGEFKRETTPTGQLFQFTPAESTVRYNLDIEDVLVSFTRDAVNPCLATAMQFVDLHTHCAFRQTVDF